MRPMVLLGDREEPAREPENPIGAGIAFFGVHEEHLDPGEDQKRAEDPDDPVITMDQLRPEPDHRPAHPQRADDAPEEHAMLIYSRHTEVGEDQRDDENVVDAQ